VNYKELRILEFCVDSKQENVVLCKASIAGSTDVRDKFLLKLEGWSSLDLEEVPG
jgi:hypothetical protein